MVTLVRFILKKYHCEDARFLKKLALSQPKNWRDFAQLLLDHVSYQGIDVYQSSTYAVCSEFLGKLKGLDLHYAKTRGGSWNCVNNEVISVREVLSILVVKYP